MKLKSLIEGSRPRGRLSRRMAAWPAVTRACLGSNGGWRPRPNSGGYVSIPGREAFGSGREMLAFAEDVARQDGWARMALSAYELEQGAISLYRKFGVSVHKSFAGSDPSAQFGGGIRRFQFEKNLW